MPDTLCNEHAECIELRRDDRERRLEAEAQLALANESLAGIEQFYVDLSAAAGRVLESADCYADGSIDDLRDALGGSEEPHDDTPDVARNIAERYAREHR